jgi:hypothetical protein
MKPEKKGLYLGALGALVVVLLIAGVSPSVDDVYDEGNGAWLQSLE